MFIVFHMGFIGGIFTTQEKAQFFVELLHEMYGPSANTANISIANVPADRPLVYIHNDLFNKWQLRYPDSIPGIF